ncbi:tetratricopeptide repeat protein, partial [Phenylobacterium sp.]|uniref:tetratricopeptide repeat protein n=1 Tax=Phenylobacterium sp. TaxID=1871053 RepID=UPI00286B6231
LALTGASAAAAQAYGEALSLYHRMGGDPFTPIEQAISDSPGFIMAHVLKANMLLVGGTPEMMMDGLAALEAAKALPGSERERGHVAALASLAGGELVDAGRILEDISIAHPRDTLALQAGQLADFLLGDSRMLRDRIARALPHWSDALPNYHAVLGMLAFGLEETGAYGRAEAAGRRALELEPCNAWAQHAVAHVLEMQDRRADGIDFMRQESTAWQHDSYFAVHNWWHLALFHLGLGETDEVLRLYDGPIYGEASPMAFDMLDAAALLWRLKLLGVDVGGRWNRLADVYEQAAFGISAFTDAHAMMAFLGAGRTEGVKTVLAAQDAALAGPGDNAMMVRDVGLPLIQAIAAFDAGDYASAADRLRGMRNRSARFGGSHAQRDLIDLTLIASARRGGDVGLERALLTERANAKPLSIGDEVLLSRAA